MTQAKPSSRAAYSAKRKPTAKRTAKPRRPRCGYTLDSTTCKKVGDHWCVPRALHAQSFFEEILVHTKGRWARTPFILTDWQRDDIVAPIFAQARWDPESRSYVRVIRIVWIELARKNGKSELLAGIALYMLVADGEEGAELYGCAKDRDQAKKVWDVAERMVQLSPLLSKRLIIKKAEKRIYDPKTSSYYEVVAADAAGNLGHNPHCVLFDEVLTQPNGDLWNAMRTGMGTRTQPLMVAATTPGDDPSGWPKKQHDHYVKVSDDADLEPHALVYMRNLPNTVADLEALWAKHPAHKELPKSIDVFDERNWKWPNPGLGDFLSLQALKDEALEARNDPLKENGFRQYRMSQWVSQITRWLPMHLYDACVGDVWPTPEWGRDKLAGRVAWAGFDLAAKFDLTAWNLLVPDPDSEAVDLLWRFWMPQGAVDTLNKRNGGMLKPWIDDGWLTVNDGDVVDYERIYADIQSDAETFPIRAMDGDQWSMEPVIQELRARAALDEEQVATYSNTFDRMTPGLTELMSLMKSGRARHHNNPVARWCFDSVEVRKASYNPDLIRPEKPARDRDSKRIDAVPSAAMAAAAWARTRDVVEEEEKAFNVW